MARTTWDRADWTVTAGGATDTIHTERGTTWALRALIAAGSEGLHPIDTGGGRWAFMVQQLRELGVVILDVEPNEAGRPGFVLDCQVRRLERVAA